jgi:hypothetical protein
MNILSEKRLVRLLSSIIFIVNLAASACWADVNDLLAKSDKNPKDIASEILKRFEDLGPEKIVTIVEALRDASLANDDSGFQKMNSKERVGHIILCIPVFGGFFGQGVAGICLDRGGLHILSGTFISPAWQLDISLLIGYYRGYGNNTSGVYHITEGGLAVLGGLKGIKLTDPSTDSSILMVGVVGGLELSLPWNSHSGWLKSIVRID